jgi:hypothetical protein
MSDVVNEQIVYVVVAGFDSSAEAAGVYMSLEAAQAAHPLDQIEVDEYDKQCGIPRWKEDRDSYGRRHWENGVIGDARVEITEAVIAHNPASLTRCKLGEGAKV